MNKLAKTKPAGICHCCNTKLEPCPFCGAQAKVFADNLVGCTNFQCEANIDWGHWTGTSDEGKPAYHYVAMAWNKRTEAGSDE